MSKIIDITDKLSFKEKSQFKIKDVVFDVNSDAPTMLKIVGIMSDKMTAKSILDMYNLLFDKKNKAKLEALKLSMNDFKTTILTIAMAVANDGEEPEGETQTPATT